MASCDDDFALLEEEENPNPHHHHHSHHHHHHHQTFNPPHRFTTKDTSINPLVTAGNGTTTPKKIAGEEEGDEEEVEEEDDYSDAGFCSENNNNNKGPSNNFHDVSPFAAEEEGNPFVAEEEEEEEEESNPNNKSVKANNFRLEKRKDRGGGEEVSDGGSPYCIKKSSRSVVGVGIPVVGGGYYRVDSRKDREEWSDSAIGCLLDAYTEKFIQLNRGNLRGRDWEEVAGIVSERCDNKQKSGKSVEQCKNKVDNLKKRYKVELQRLNNSGSNVSHWPWFKKIEQVVGNSPSSKGVSDEDKSPGSSANMIRQPKRYAITLPSSVGLVNNAKTKSLPNPRWRRVVFKISGAALVGTGPQKTDPKVTMLIAREVAMACRVGVEVAIVVGGRNFFCGDTWVAATGLDRSTAYQIGMMATVMNSILLQSALEKLGVHARVQTVFPMQEAAEPYNKRRAIRHLEKGRVVIFGGIGAGTGSPLFTTDTAAALRASEINADAILKGTNVDGVYDCHSGNSNNVAFEHISYRDLVSRGVTSMDMMATTFCEENGIPVVVFNLLEPGNISRALCGDQVGTLIDQTGRIS